MLAIIQQNIPLPTIYLQQNYIVYKEPITRSRLLGHVCLKVFKMAD